MKARTQSWKLVQTEISENQDCRTWTYVGEDATVYGYTPTRKREEIGRAHV